MLIVVPSSFSINGAHALIVVSVPLPGPKGITISIGLSNFHAPEAPSAGAGVASFLLHPMIERDKTSAIVANKNLFFIFILLLKL
ncbi:hypothetical protein SDC9_190681 [bioreactor metagenome]|uniref:Uncharacterized protein n=1 Tax=bioreactor metagenome TaxID=1076179 RepID=A0A645HXA4_9ZZZZ